MKKITLVLCALVAALIPMVALAQDAAPAAPVLGLGWAAIIAIVSAVGAVLSALSNAPALAGYRTYIALAATVIAGVADSLTQLTARGEAITTGALLTAVIAAAIGRVKAGK